MLKPLTSFRFFAALAVFGSHLSYFRSVPRVAPLYVAVLTEGYAGVTFFFILSGFILTYNYADRIRDLDTTQLRRFYVARVARIYPVHLLALAASLPLVWASFVDSRGSMMVEMALNGALLQSFVPMVAIAQSFNGPSWSLVDEMFFYSLLPLGLWALTRLIGRRPALVYPMLAVAIWVAALAVVRVSHTGPATYWFLYVNPVFRTVDFAIGVLLGNFFLLVDRRQREAPRVPIGPGQVGLFTILELAAVAALACIVWKHDRIPQPYRWGVCYQPAMAALILVFAYQRGAASRLLSTRPLVFLGEISFSFYMFHWLVLQYLLRADGGAAGPHNIGLSLVALIATLLISALVYGVYEVPARDRIRRYAAG